MNILIPLGLALAGLFGLTIFLLTTALVKSTNKLTDLAEQLILLVGMGQQGEAAARALVAKAQTPKKSFPPAGRIIETKPEQKPEGIIMKIGA